jgi:hypothetical protein
VGVIDPHGDLFQNLKARIAQYPQLWERVILLDPCDRKWVVSFNPLEAVRGLSHERVSLFLTDVMMKIWGLDVTSTPRLVWLLTNTCLALSSLGLTLLEMPRWLLDAEFRERLLPKVTHEQARAYFAFEYPKNSGAAHQWATPLLNKVGGLIFDSDVRLMVAGRSTFNFRDELDGRKILLAHLPKGVIGEGSSALLGAFIVAHLQKAALSRADTPNRQPYFLYLDEFQNYTTDNIQDILSESRKYALSLTLAHQYLDQLSPELRSGVLNTTGTVCAFRVGHGDAVQLAREIFPSPEFMAEREHSVQLRHFWRLPLVTVRERVENPGWEGLTHQLTSLAFRQFWARRRGVGEPVKLKTLDVPDIAYTPQLKATLLELREQSGLRYGRLKSEVRKELEAETRATPTPTQNPAHKVGYSDIWSD